MNESPLLFCPICGSLNVYPSMPNDMNKMPIFCHNCKQTSEVNIKIDGIGENGKLKVTFLPDLII